MLYDGKPCTAFGELLSKFLYNDILECARNEDIDGDLRDALSNPRWLKKKQVIRLLRFFNKNYSESTLVQLSRSLSRAREARKGPIAILNFNADTLLYALLDLYLVEEHNSRTCSWGHPRYSYQRALRGIGGTRKDTTAIYHCHGAVVPEPSGRLKLGRKDSREHLVFTETDYLNIAGNIATWSQSLFLFHAQNSQLLIIGHSLSDPNIRKWLGWSATTYLDELTAIATSTTFAPRHTWIARKHSDDALSEIAETTLLHLGVRVCWVSEWADIGRVFENLLGL